MSGFGRPLRRADLATYAALGLPLLALCAVLGYRSMFSNFQSNDDEGELSAAKKRGSG